jgi:hypothetical protein
MHISYYGKPRHRVSYANKDGTSKKRLPIVHAQRRCLYGQILFISV